MTQLAIRGYTLGLDLYQGIVNFFDAFGKGIAMSRSVEANWQVAQKLQHDYKDQSVAEIAAMLNERSRKDIYGA